MASTILINPKIVGGATDSQKAILVKDGLIAAFSSDGSEWSAENTIDCSGVSIFPGFIDVHIHGAVGIDVNTASSDGLLAIAQFLAGMGVTAWVPTLVPDSDENYRKVIQEIDRLMEMQEGRPVAQALGVHYEGAFANRQMCGALRPEYFKTFTGLELRELPVPKSGAKMMTFSPEIEGGIELASALKSEGWTASIGHTNADVGTLDRVFGAGARHMTHFFNAMSGVHHREVGVAGWGLANKGVTFDIIADGLHVDPRMLGVAVESKSPELVTLISDSVAPTGLGDGEFEIWGERVSVREGRTKNERGSIAGSVITMLDAVRRMLSLGFAERAVAEMASSNPAKLLGLESSRGSIEVGKRADIVALDGSCDVRFTMVGGTVVENTQGTRA